MSERVAALMMSVTRLPRLVSPVRMWLNLPSRAHSILGSEGDGGGGGRKGGREGGRGGKGEWHCEIVNVRSLIVRV